MSEENPAPSSKPSPIPSWVMLGFALGALTIWSLPHSAREEPEPEPTTPEVKSAPPPPPSPAVIRTQQPLEGPPLARIENVFAEFGKYAVWSDDSTEVALWNTATRGFSDYFEVLKVDDKYYVRTIPELDRPVLTHGVPPELPIEFTESEEQRQEWLRETDDAAWRALGRTLGNQPAAPPKP